MHDTIKDISILFLQGLSEKHVSLGFGQWVVFKFLERSIAYSFG